MPAYKNKTAGTWYVKFYYTAYDGEKRQKKKAGFALKREAEAYEREFLQLRAFQPDMPFKAFYDVFKRDTEPKLRPGTIQTRFYLAKNHILPYFGEMPLSSIDARTVTVWHNSIIEQGFSPTHQHKLHKHLSSVFNHAVRLYGLSVNPCRQAGAIGSMKPANEMVFWTLEEYQQVIANVDDIKARTAISLLYWSGMRKGELLALRWEDIDFTDNRITIDESYQRINGKQVVGKTKTGVKRIIKMTQATMDDLAAYRKRIYDPAPRDFIFFWEKRFIEEGMRKARLAAGVKHIRVHDLRHSHASLLINHGVNIMLISKRLGHEKVSITLDTYSHLFPDKELELLDVMERVQNI